MVSFLVVVFKSASYVGGGLKMIQMMFGVRNTTKTTSVGLQLSGSFYLSFFKESYLSM